MKKSDTEQEQPGLEENKVPDSQSKRELDRELQELAEKEHQEEIYYEERRRERHERNLKKCKCISKCKSLCSITMAYMSAHNISGSDPEAGCDQRSRTQGYFK